MHAVRTGCGFSRFISLCQGTRAEVTELLMSIGLDNFLEGSNLLGDLGVLHAGGPSLGNLELALVEGLALHLPLGLKCGHNVLVLPADLVSEPAKGAEPPSVLQPQNLKSRGDHHQLLLVIGRGHTLEGLQPLQSVLATLSLVGGHSTDGAPEDLGWCPEVERSTGGLDVATFLQEVEVLQLVAVEVAAHVDALAPDNDNLVAGEDELGNDGGEPPHEVATTINHDRLRRYSRHLLL